MSETEDSSGQTTDVATDSSTTEPLPQFNEPSTDEISSPSPKPCVTPSSDATGRQKTPINLTDGESKRGGSSKDADGRGLGKKRESAPSSAHRVTFTVTIAKAIPTDEEEIFENKDSFKKKRRIVEAPRAQNYYHYEYRLLPENEEEAVKTDVVMFGMAAKIYTERQEPKVLKTWHDGSTTWVAWTHCHTITITEELLIGLFNHTLEFRIWDTKDKLSTRARFDRPKAFRLPQSKPGEDADNVGGVKGLVLKQSKSYEKLQPKRSFTDRPLPAQVRMTKDEPEVSVAQAPKPAKKGKTKDKSSIAESQTKPAVVKKEPERYVDNASAVSNSLIKVPIKDTEHDSNKSYAHLARLAGVNTPVEGKENKSSRLSQSGSTKHILPQSPTGSSKSNHQADRSGSPATRGTAESESSMTSKKTGLREPTASRPRKNKKAEAAAQAAAEHIRKYGVCCIPIKMAKLFAGLQTITERLEAPVPGSIEDCFVTVSLNGPLMSDDQLKKLNPMVVKVHSATNMPCTPLSHAELRLRCKPTYIRYKLFNQDVHQSVGREQDQNVYWDDLNVFLTGILETSQLKELLNGPPLEIEVHDRDRVPEKQKLKPTLFGDDLEDEKISNVGIVTSKRTLHNAFAGKGQPWDPYGLASFDLHDLLLGQQYLHLKSPILPCKIPDVLGTRENKSADGKLVGVFGAVDGPEEQPLRQGHYLESEAMMKIKIELAYPLTASQLTGESEDSVIPETCPFARLVFIFDYRNVNFLHKLLSIVTSINASALGMDNFPSHVLEAALSTYKLSAEQQQSAELDIVTGFQVLDSVFHMFVLEGLKDKALLQLWTSFPKPENEDVTVLYNSDLSFCSRLYGPLDVDLCRIKLHEPLSVIVQQSLLYVRDMVPKPCFDALVKLEELSKVKKLRDAVRNNLFPSADMVVSMSREFGVPLTEEDFTELETREVQCSVEETKPRMSQSAPKPSRNWTPIDNYNPQYMENLMERAAAPPSAAYNKQHKRKIAQKSAVNALERSKTMPATVKIATDNPHNYSTQRLNSTAQAHDVLRDVLAKDAPGHLFTRCPDYHHSMTVVPVNVDAVHKAEADASRGAWKTQKGFVFPGHKTMGESNKHPLRPHMSRVEELTTKWEENTLHRGTLKPTLEERERFTWDDRHQDLDIWTKPHPIFGKEPITIHEAGIKLKAEKLVQSKKDFEEWRSKIKVDDTRLYTHRLNPQTELTEAGPKSSNQISKLRGVLKDPPTKYALTKPGMAIKDLSPLNVVLNPSVDTAARASGLPVLPAVEGEMNNNDKGFYPGPYEKYSWSVERNRIPAHDYEHKKFELTNGQDFIVYHKDRSNLHKRSIQPLTDDEYKTHLFKESRPPPYYVIPDIEDFKHRQATDHTYDSGFVSMGAKTLTEATIEAN